MSQPSQVNGAVTDTVATSNTSVVGDAPSMAIGSLYQTIGNSVAMAAANAVYAQQQTNVSFQTSNTIGVSKILNAK